MLSVKILQQQQPRCVAWRASWHHGPKSVTLQEKQKQKGGVAELGS